LLHINIFWNMMIIMRKQANKEANYRATAKEVSHERIVAAAAKAIRRSGYDGTGVADIMKEAGLTHGAFYAHFESREALLVEAADRASAESSALAASVVASALPNQALRALMETYLSKAHLEGIETGCPFSALGSEMPRQSPEVRLVATRRIKEMVDLIARQMPDWGHPSGHERALLTVASMVGALILARAVNDPTLANAFCSATVKGLALPNTK
jgi:TetR/AcrR family transcriptional regulator, transcriptional repressor for nem operon